MLRNGTEGLELRCALWEELGRRKCTWDLEHGKFTRWKDCHLHKTVKLSLWFNGAPRHEDVLREWRYSFTYPLASALDGSEWSASRPGRFTPRERAPGTHWIGGWVGPRAVLDAAVKRKVPSSRRESNPRTPIVQPGTQSYTDWAITAPAIHEPFKNAEIAMIPFFLATWLAQSA
jgi:hypothetical protein